MDREDVLTTIRDAVADVEVVYLFGSRAEGENRPDSDVDLALLAPEPLEPVFRWELQERLAARLGASVDLVDLRQASTVMRVEVLRTGTVLFERDSSARAAFEAMALKAYALLNEERQLILDDIRRRGSVHG